MCLYVNPTSIAMKQKFTSVILLTITLLSITTILASSYDDNINEVKATCTGSSSCNACKNCKYCSKDGGRCSICK
jgi:hypothetical protein